MPGKFTLEDLKKLVAETVLATLAETPGSHPGNKGLLGPPGQHGKFDARDPANPSKEVKLFTDEITEFSGDFKTFGAFLHEIAFNPGSELLTRAGEMGEDDVEQGGYLLPVQMGELLWLDTLGQSVIFNKCRRVNMTSASQKFPRVVDSDHSTNLYDGLEFKFIAEKAQKTATKPKIKEIELKSRTMFCMTHVTNSLLQDSRPSVEVMLRKMYASGAAWKMDELIFRGTGAGQPLGILGSSALITQAAEGGQAASTIVWPNVLKMWSQLIPALQSKATWFIHPSAVEQVMTMSVPVGTGGSVVMTADQGGGVRPIPKSMLGAPIVWTEHASYLGQKLDILLAVPAAYICGMRKGLSIDVSRHLKFDKNETSFRAEMRIDGQPQIDETLTLRDGTHVVSPFVTLAARN